MDRFSLTIKEGGNSPLLLHDEATGLSVSFQRGRFNVTQQITLPVGWPATPEGATRLAQTLAEMAEWLRTNHYGEAMPLPVDFVYTVKTKMKEKGIRGFALAEELGITPGAFSNFLNRKHGLEQSKLEALLTMLGLRLS